MTQIFGSVAYCRGKDLTFLLSDRKLTKVAEIAPGLYGEPIGEKELEPECKVKVAGNHIFGLGGFVSEASKEESIPDSISKIVNHSEAYNSFLEACQKMVKVK